MVMIRIFHLPIISGGHALYIASDQIFEYVPLENCPAEYLNAILMNALQVRGCGLGHIVYSKRENGKIISNDLSMDSLRLAVPR
jgi:tryptophanase